ncbi:hypothetical protein ACKKBF_B32170 [Auxenochlorella protothecoides x Auxenochlorella symbiontica]
MQIDTAAHHKASCQIKSLEVPFSESWNSLHQSETASGSLGPLLASSDGSSLTIAAWGGLSVDGHPGAGTSWRDSSISPMSRPPLGLEQHPAPSIDQDIIGMLSVAYQQEAELRPDAEYLHRHSPTSARHGPRLSAGMRRMGLGWMVEVALDQGLTQEALSLAVSLLDRYMSAAQNIPVAKFQLVCTACLLIAAKHEEEVHPAVSELTGLSDGSFSEADLRCAELAVLQTLSYRVNCPTLYTFLLLLNRALGLNPRSSALACYLTELSMLEYGMLAFAPSHVACSAVALANLYFNEPLPMSAMLATMPYTPASLLPGMQALLHLHQAAHGAPTGTEAAVVRDKFRAYEWQGAGTVHPFQSLPGSLTAGPWALMGAGPPGKS